MRRHAQALGAARTSRRLSVFCDGAFLALSACSTASRLIGSWTMNLRAAGTALVVGLCISSLTSCSGAPKPQATVTVTASPATQVPVTVDTGPSIEVKAADIVKTACIDLPTFGWSLEAGMWSQDKIDAMSKADQETARMFNTIALKEWYALEKSVQSFSTAATLDPTHWSDLSDTSQRVYAQAQDVSHTYKNRFDFNVLDNDLNFIQGKCAAASVIAQS